MGSRAVLAFDEKAIDMAKVLLVDDDASSRLTLQTVLTMGGYTVDSASSSAEAVKKLVGQEYSLVLSDLHSESPDAGLQVMAFARTMHYRPATALLRSYHSVDTSKGGVVLIEPEDVPELLEKVAELIGERASRMLERELRQSRN